jgi:hypothetical protein
MTRIFWLRDWRFLCMVSYGSWVVLVVLDVASGLCSARPTDFDHPILRVLCENVLGKGKYIKKTHIPIHRYSSCPTWWFSSHVQVRSVFFIGGYPIAIGDNRCWGTVLWATVCPWLRWSWAWWMVWEPVWPTWSLSCTDPASRQKFSRCIA